MGLFGYTKYPNNLYPVKFYPTNQDKIFLSQTFVYSVLLHFPLNMNCRWMLGAVNMHLNRLSSRSLASVVCSHLFVGGQGLEGEKSQSGYPIKNK